MPEGIPKKLTAKEAFNDIRRATMRLYISSGKTFSEEFTANMMETAKAVNLLYEEIGHTSALPNSWDGLGYDSQTNFLFVKEVDGNYFKRVRQYANPQAFVDGFREFHKLTELVSEEEKETVAAEAARLEAERLKLEVAAKSGQLWRDRMSESAVIPEIKKPEKTSVSPFRFRK
jgi:hypothetical protein